MKIKLEMGVSDLSGEITIESYGKIKLDSDRSSILNRINSKEF